MFTAMSLILNRLYTLSGSHPHLTLACKRLCTVCDCRATPHCMQLQRTSQTCIYTGSATATPVIILVATKQGIILFVPFCYMLSQSNVHNCFLWIFPSYRIHLYRVSPWEHTLKLMLFLRNSSFLWGYPGTSSVFSILVIFNIDHLYCRLVQKI